MTGQMRLYDIRFQLSPPAPCTGRLCTRPPSPWLEDEDLSWWQAGGCLRTGRSPAWPVTAAGSPGSQRTGCTAAWQDPGPGRQTSLYPPSSVSHRLAGMAWDFSSPAGNE